MFSGWLIQDSTMIGKVPPYNVFGFWGLKKMGRILNNPFLINLQGPQNRGSSGVPLLRIPNFYFSEVPNVRGGGGGRGGGLLVKEGPTLPQSYQETETLAIIPTLVAPPSKP